jgi:UDP-2-acetamido-3-amino-2,3-dideoxy-glucuronate N-acetyltransferase
MIHSHAYVDDSVEIGAGTYVWQFASLTRGTVLGKDCVVWPHVNLDGPEFGDRCVIASGVAMGPGFLFGDDCFVGPNVTFCNDTWPVTDKRGFDEAKLRETGFWTIICADGVGIGANAVVLPGVRIGKNSVVAAGSVVDRHIPDNHLWINGSSREIKKIPERTVQCLMS